ncbi:hypothetical protein H6G76_03040 [Nostoc sp. FACHB-152]|uniref:hypothetical protein n=1 Tax=unclassified Nostoc TaxID=2593658 RepID=UPI0016867DEF|nr:MULTISPECIES: hypothetical protein [unclassified Nostoc]MBD2446147.1 hypothetical protein [Nostoc sp. FACHB-152]MBD2467379.1 hypothetical protein [Nostoc sp. FACHB-145]
MLKDSKILDVLLIPRQKSTNILTFVHFCRDIWLMVQIRVIAHGIPQNLIESDKGLQDTEAKTIKLPRVPSLGEYIIWRNQNFRITKVTYFPDNYAYTAAIEMEWCETV